VQLLLLPSAVSELHAGSLHVLAFFFLKKFVSLLNAELNPIHCRCTAAGPIH